MGIITGYPDDTTTSASDKFLTSDSTGATKLTPASTLKDYVLADGNVTTAKILDANVTTAKIATAAVTPVKWTNPYKFSVYRTASHTFSISGQNKVPFDTEEYDSNNNFDSTTNFRYTVPVTGFYHFDGAVTLGGYNQGTGYSVSLYKNGSLVRRGNAFVSYYTGNGFGQTLTVGANLSLAAADYIELYCENNSQGLVTGVAISYLNGHLVSQT